MPITDQQIEKMFNDEGKDDTAESVAFVIALAEEEHFKIEHMIDRISIIYSRTVAKILTAGEAAGEEVDNSDTAYHNGLHSIRAYFTKIIELHRRGMPHHEIARILNITSDTTPAAISQRQFELSLQEATKKLDASLDELKSTLKLSKFKQS